MLQMGPASPSLGLGAASPARRRRTPPACRAVGQRRLRGHGDTSLLWGCGMQPGIPVA